MIAGTLLALQAHMFIRIGVCKPVFQHAIDERGVAEFAALAEGGQVVRRVGHGFRAACYDGVGVPCHDRLDAENDGFEGRGADFVDGGADGGVGHAGAEGTLPGWVLPETGDV